MLPPTGQTNSGPQAFTSGLTGAGIFGQKGRTLGDILQYFPETNSYLVHVRGVRAPISMGSKVTTLGRISPLLPGTTVVVDFSSPTPHIDGALPRAYSQSTIAAAGKKIANGPLSGAAFSASLPMKGTGPSYRQPGIPMVLPEEWVQSSPDGNFLSILRGKLNILHGSEKAQIITSGLHDLVRIVSEHYEHFTSLGFTTIQNTNGRNSLMFRAAADQMFEAGGDEKQWTFKLDLYPEDGGDAFHMQICTNENKTMAEVGISSDGRIEVYAVNGIQFTNAGGSPYIENNASDKLVNISKDYSLKVGGKFYEKCVGKNMSNSASQLKGIAVDDSCNIGRNHSRLVGGTHSMVVTGGLAATAVPTNLAVCHDIVNGSYRLNIGDITKMANPAAQQSYNLIVHNGQINIGLPNMLSPSNLNPSNLLIKNPPNPLFAINLITGLPGQLKLGGDPMTCLDNPCKFSFFNMLMKVLLGLLDGHTHVANAANIAAGFTGPVGQTTPLPIFTPALTAMIDPIKSQYVNIPYL